MSVIKYSVKNPVIVNILTAAILIMGIISLVELPRELSPKVSFNWIFIIIPYPGIGAEEIEKLVVIPVEDAIQDIDDIKLISGEANEGGGFVWIQFEEINDETFRERLNQVESEINALDLPEASFDPIIDSFDSDDFMPVISLSITGDIPEKELRELTEDLKDDLIDIKNVGQIATTGIREREIWIEVEPEKLYKHGLSLSQVAGAISSRNLSIPAGKMKVGRQEYLIRTIGEIEAPEEFGKIVVRWNPQGNHLYLGEIASIKDTWERERTRSRLDGNPAATLSISKRAKSNSLETIALVKEVAEKYRSRLPKEAKIIFTNDNAVWIKDMLHKLQTNAQLGFILVVIVLYVFMGLRNALVAAIGIPVAFMATFIFMNYTGQSFNGNSLFGLILILGVVVDDAIIVIENCFRHRQKGMSRKDAAIVGTTEVMGPVIAATLTTVAAFMPLILMTGIMGKFMRIIPIVVCTTLAASMIEVFLIAPSHFAEWGGSRGLGGDKWFIKIKTIYSKMLMWMIRRRYLVGPALFLIIIIMISTIALGLIPVEFYRGDEFSQFTVLATMPPGTRLDETDKVIRRIEDAARNLPDEEVHTVIANPGLQQTEDDWIYADHVGQVIVDLVEPNFRKRSMAEIKAELNEKIKHIEGPVIVRLMEYGGGPPPVKPVAVKVKGKYLDELEIVADEVKTELETIPGVHSIGSDNLTGKQELQLKVDEARAAIYGLNVIMIAGEIQMAVDGLQVTVYREGDEEVDVRLKMAGMYDAGIESLKGLSIATPTGALVRLDNFCDFSVEPTLFKIKRYKQERAITVSAEIDKRVTTAVKVNQELQKRFKDLPQRHPGYRLDFSGEMEEFAEAFNELTKLFLFGVIMIFTILAAQFKSVRQSFIILLTIPFGFIGSMIGLFIIQSPFSITTMFGMIALAGIAVNDAIVMVSFINNARERGESNWRSIIEAGRVRLRPVILTSVTTILGLLPMAIGLGGKSESWGPMANVIIFGLLGSTLLTLLVIPTVYSIIVDDWFGYIPLKRRLKRRKQIV
ncbi:efflux RND transporter permease subunit [bacterium]|nr:efflux RND transporter permease subunit [bacterium]